MITLKYNYYENNTTKTHSWFARPKFGATLDQDDLLEEALDGKSIEPSIARAAITEYMKTVKRNVLRGNRCELGEDFLTLYPNLQLSVKDRIDPSTGELIVATPEMLDAKNAISRIGCQVSSKFSKEFALNVKWKKENKEVSPANDNDVTQNNENVENGQDNTQNVDTSTGDDGLGG